MLLDTSCTSSRQHIAMLQTRITQDLPTEKSLHTVALVHVGWHLVTIIPRSSHPLHACQSKSLRSHFLTFLD